MKTVIVLLSVLVAVLVASSLYARFGIQPEPPSHGPEQRVIRVQVLNGSGESGLGTRVATYLREGGFHVVEIKNADRSDYVASLVVARREDLGSARAVARYLGQPPIIKQAWSSDLAEVTLVLGSDRSRLRLD